MIMDEKNEKDFHVIFYLTSPRRGQFQSDNQCMDPGAEAIPDKGEKWIWSFHIFKCSQINRQALQKRLGVLKALPVSVLENLRGLCETP